MSGLWGFHLKRQVFHRSRPRVVTAVDLDCRDSISGYFNPNDSIFSFGF